MWIVDGFFLFVLASMPGGDLLFHRLSDSTIGAVGFHVRVRDGIGWDTDAMATRQWSQHGFPCRLLCRVGEVQNRCTDTGCEMITHAQRCCWGCELIKRE